MGSGQERGPHAQHRHKASEEDDCASAPAKEVETQFQLALVETDEVTVAAQQAVAALAPNPEAEVIAQDGPAGCCGNDQHHGELVCGARVDGCHQQHRLAGKGNARTLDGNTRKDGPIAVGGEQHHEACCTILEHLVCPLRSVLCTSAEEVSSDGWVLAPSAGYYTSQK